MTATVDVHKTYTPYGGARSLWSCKKSAILYDGPAGTGKTRAVLEKANRCAMKYPGCRILFVRKTRTSLTESVLVTFEEHVLPADSPVKSGAMRRVRQSYTYPNGSTIVCGGLDNPDRIMSTEYDMVCIFEATESTQDDFEKLITRLRNGVIPYQQLICDCNPSFPAHWLKLRADKDEMHRIISRHQDNPTVTDDYLYQLSRLSGHRRARLFMGQWVAAEGLVYDKWDTAIFVQPRDEKFPRVFIGVDEGYSNPASVHVYCVDSDGRMHVAEEWYKTKQLETAVVSQVQAFAAKWKPEAVIVDPSAAKLIAALRVVGMPVREANNDVFGGIQSCQERLVVSGDSRPRITIDPGCRNWLQEIEGYQWAENRDGSLKDKPDKANDHAMDEWRYVSMYVKEHSGNMEVIVL